VLRPQGRAGLRMATPSALEGIRVLDFTHALSGPYCTMLLSDYGATVYKLEDPGGGDMGRGWGPPFAGGLASFFLGLNRGKYGIAINLKDKRGAALCLDIVDKMDVLIQNFAPARWSVWVWATRRCTSVIPAWSTAASRATDWTAPRATRRRWT